MHILAHYFHTARITCGCMWKSLNMTAKNLQSNPVWPYIPHEMHMLAHYFHTTRSTCGCMWRNVNMNSKKTHSQIPCGITFHIKCTCSHIISTQQNQHVEFCMQTLSRISPNRDLAVDELYNSMSIYRNLAIMQLLCL